LCAACRFSACGHRIRKPEFRHDFTLSEKVKEQALAIKGPLLALAVCGAVCSTQPRREQAYLSQARANYISHYDAAGQRCRLFGLHKVCEKYPPPTRAQTRLEVVSSQIRKSGAAALLP
jgi:hypothetical protein